jgi:hypothetical protein
MQHRHLMTGVTTIVSVVFLQLALVSLGAAQFKVTDNFNRPDGAPGLGWSTWGNGAQISDNQLETFGENDVAGGIGRTLDVTFPLSFSFDFSTDTPSDGGWQIGFNAAIAGQAVNGELGLFQYNGSGAVCSEFQTSSGPSIQCGETVVGQRDFTAQAHISGTVNPDFSSKVTIQYNDGLTPKSITLKTPTPVGAIQNPLGSILCFGNSNASYGPHFFDNFSLTLE